MKCHTNRLTIRLQQLIASDFVMTSVLDVNPLEQLLKADDSLLDVEIMLTYHSQAG